MRGSQKLHCKNSYRSAEHLLWLQMKPWAVQSGTIIKPLDGADDPVKMPELQPAYLFLFYFFSECQ